MVVWVIYRLRVGRIVRRITDRMAVSLWVARVRIDFVTGEDDCALTINENMWKKRGEIRTNRKE